MLLLWLQYIPRVVDRMSSINRISTIRLYVAVLDLHLPEEKEGRVTLCWHGTSCPFQGMERRLIWYSHFGRRSKKSYIKLDSFCVTWQGWKPTRKQENLRSWKVTTGSSSGIRIEGYEQIWTNALRGCGGSKSFRSQSGKTYKNMFSGWHIRTDDLETLPFHWDARCAFMHELCLPLELLLSNAIAISPTPLSLQPQARGESHCIRRLGLANHTLDGDRHIWSFKLHYVSHQTVVNICR